MSKIAIVYGSSAGATELIAEKIQAFFEYAALFNAKYVSTEVLKQYDFLIFGASTTGVGELQYDWKILLKSVKIMDFTDKKVAIFGLGNSTLFSTSFAESIFEIYEALVGKVEIVGSVPIDGYIYEKSRAIVNGRFVGLALDEDNEYDETDTRLAAWIQDLRKYMI